MRINIVCNIMERGRDWSYPRRAIELKERLKDCEVVLSKQPIHTRDWDIIHYIPFNTEFVEQSAPLRVAYMGNFSHWDKVIYGRGLKDAIGLVDFAIFQNEVLYKKAIEKGVDKSKIALVRPGMDLDEFRIQIRVGVAARLKRNECSFKGEIILLRLFQKAHWKNFKFIFAGKYWKEEFGERYRAQGANVEFLDSVPYNKMPDFYNSIDYLLMPSSSESGPLVFVEALACGRPVISRKVGFTPEYNAIFFNNVDELEKILRSIERKYLKRREQVENLTWDKWAEEHRKIYKGVILCSLGRNSKS